MAATDLATEPARSGQTGPEASLNSPTPSALSAFPTTSRSSHGIALGRTKSGSSDLRIALAQTAVPPVYNDALGPLGAQCVVAVASSLFHPP